MAIRKLPNFLRDQEVAQLLDAAGAQVDLAKTPAATFAARRDLILITVGLKLGLRVSELANLNVEQLDLEQRSAFVFQGKGGKDRYVPIPQSLVEPLRQWLGERASGPVFANKNGRRPSIRSLQLHITHLGRIAGLTKRLKAHSLRHTYATTLKDRGVQISDIQELLGHSSIATTTVYLHCDPGRLKGAVDRL